MAGRRLLVWSLNRPFTQQGKAFPVLTRLQILRKYYESQQNKLHGGQGQTNVAIGRDLNLSASYVGAVIRRFEAGGDVAPDPQGGAHNVKLDDAAIMHLARTWRAWPAAPLTYYQDRLRYDLGLDIETSTLCKLFKDLRLNLRKVPRFPIAKWSVENTRYYRAFEQLFQDFPIERLRFQDEVGTQHGDVGRGVVRAFPGNDLPFLDDYLVEAPARGGPNHSMFALTCARPFEPPIIWSQPATGAMTSREHLEWALGDAIHTLHEGDVWVRDNCRIHGTELDDYLQEVFDIKHVRCFELAAYSPEKNPIEFAFSKFKYMLKRLHRDQEITSACNWAMSQITHRDMISWYRNCGYRG